MKRYISSTLKIFLYYLLLFAVCRTVFLLYFFQQISAQGNATFFQSLWHALPLDISAASYLIFIPLVLLFLQQVARLKVITKILRGYIIFTSAIVTLLGISEIAIYREVHIKLYFSLLSHLRHPDELIRSVSPPLLITVLGLVAIIIYGCVLLTDKLLPKSKQAPYASSYTQKGILFFSMGACIGLAVVGCRGGLQPIPINEGEVYFSNNQCLNDATVNPLWNLLHSYVETRKVIAGNAYKVMPDEEARRIVNELYAVSADSTNKMFKTARPNICFIILESWSAEVVERLNGYKGLTPNFSKLVQDGYIYTNCYSSGHVSDQGIPAILSGYPALPIGSAINNPAKAAKLPCINQQLSAEGYSSSFFFGGQLIYGGIKSYIYNSNFNRVVEQQTLSGDIPAGRLGIHDSTMLHIWLDSLNYMQSPFFSCLFTLSTHSPFDAPMPHDITWGGMENNYLNSVVYADRQLGMFFDMARKQPWYDNTVFVLVSDHSHNVPKNYSYDSPEYYHIPLLITGGALRDDYHGEMNDNFVSQVDIATTLLKQLDLDASPYVWSKNLENKNTASFAFYTFNEGYGYVDGDMTVWNKKYPHSSFNTATDTLYRRQIKQRGDAMLQVLMEDFINK